MLIEPYWNDAAYRLRVRNETVVKYTPLLVHVAKTLWGKRIARRIGTFDDLVSSGYESLLRAAELYDPNHVSRASEKTYYYRSILRAMLRAADEGGIIRVPASTLRAVRAPSVKTKPQTEEVCRSVNAAIGIMPLPSDYDAYVDDDASEKIWQEDISNMLDCLPKDIRESVARSFGIGVPQESMAKIGKDHGVTGQAIRQRRKHGLDVIGDKLVADGLGNTN